MSVNDVIRYVYSIQQSGKHILKTYTKKIKIENEFIEMKVWTFQTKELYIVMRTLKETYLISTENVVLKRVIFSFAKIN